MAWWTWILFGLALLVVEMLTPGGLFALFFGLSALAVSVKRWHDRDKSGWWVLLNLLPVIGWLWALIDNGFLRGSVGPNRFGEDPLAADQ